MSGTREPDKVGDRAEAEASEHRIHRNTYLVIALAMLAGVALSNWKMVAGIAVGGVLSILNQRWLRSSVVAILGIAAGHATGAIPRWTVTKFLLRYAVIGTAAGAALWSRKIDLIGFGIGIASIVWAVMIEAGYQVYLTFKPRS
ncbi:MAG: ATP synthase subunit I [Acidobacteriota bacterium]